VAISSTVSSNRVKLPAPIDEPRHIVGAVKAGRLMTPDEKTKVKLAIKSATNAEEIRKLEQQLQEGWIPN